MEQITVVQVGAVITFLVGLIGGIKYLQDHVKEWMSEGVKEQIEPISKKIDNLGDQITKVDIENTRNFLGMQISDIEKGVYFDELEKERFWKEYEHYKKIGGNSYIERKVEALKVQGKL